MTQPTVCVVVDARECTELPADALLALTQQTVPEPFEILVLCAPTTATSWLDQLPPNARPVLVPDDDARARTAAFKELRADLVLLTSARAVPPATWIEQLRAELQVGGVAAAGGVLDEGCILDAQGNVHPTRQPDLDHLCFPGSNLVPLIDAWNCAFRATALHEIKAEQLADFRELLRRLVNVGYLIRPRPGISTYPSRSLEASKASRVALDAKQGGSPPEQTARPLNVALVSQAYPPGASDGLATLTYNLAHALVARGHWVHVITRPVHASVDEASNVQSNDGQPSDSGPDTDRISYEAGVWIHQVPESAVPLTDFALDVQLPAGRWNWSANALSEIDAVGKQQPIDVVEAPIARGQGIAALQSGRYPLVTSLQTSLALWINTAGRKLTDKWWRKTGTPVLAVETRLLRQSDAIRAISGAIKTEIATVYSVDLDDGRTIVAPLGMGDVDTSAQYDGAAVPAPTDSSVVVLFVGRFEHRKGIDVLLDSIPRVLQRAPNATFVLIGKDEPSTQNGGRTYRQMYESKPEFAACLDRVEFRGAVSDEELTRAVAGADVFVGPSRFESFGLVFVEAMRCGVPVIGCDIGGMPEVIQANVTGLVVPPGDSAALTDAIVTLVTDAELRAEMGAAGRDDFTSRFTLEAMAIQSESIYDIAIRNHDQSTRS